MGLCGHIGNAHCRCNLCPNLVCSSARPLCPSSPQREYLLASVKTESFSHITLIACEAALQAGEVLRRGYRTDFAISVKEGRHNLVTEFDHLAEKTIISFLKQNVPDSSFLAEESGETGKKSDYLWIIDPLDGTVNFAHQIPIFSVSIAVEFKGNILSGVIYQPITHELFVAERGKGAFLNGDPISVSKTSDTSQSMLATGFPYNLHENPFHCIDHFVDILRCGIPIRRLGSAAIDLAYTAAGRLDGFFEIGLAPWDCAAGILLIEEAGGKVTSWDGKPFHLRPKLPILATNGKIHHSLSQILNRSIP